MAKLSPGRFVSSFEVLALLLVGLVQVDAKCYLLDANADCAVCWKTTYHGIDDKVGTTKMFECPAGINEKWTMPLPEKMNAMEKYTAGYSLQLARDKFGHMPQGDHDIPHANIHSCVASRGACTPFVSNSPGLATHTEAIVADFDQDGFVNFKSDVQLTEEQYTIIAHIRFFVEDSVDVSFLCMRAHVRVLALACVPHMMSKFGQNTSNPNSKYDVAIGVSRIVVPPKAEVSLDSWISTGVAGHHTHARAHTHTHTFLAVRKWCRVLVRISDTFGRHRHGVTHGPALLDPISWRYRHTDIYPNLLPYKIIVMPPRPQPLRPLLPLPRLYLTAGGLLLVVMSSLVLAIRKGARCS